MYLGTLLYSSTGNSNSLNLWQVDLFGLAMAMAMPVSFTLLEMNDNSQKCLSNTLSVSLNFWTSFPVVLWEMAALPKWYALKSSAIHCYYQPFHLHSSISSIHSFFYQYFKNIKLQYLSFQILRTPCLYRGSSKIFSFNPHDKCMSWLLFLLPFCRGINGGRGRLSHLSSIIELINGKSRVLGLGKENKLNRIKWVKKHYIN